VIRCLITDGSAWRDETRWLRLTEHWLAEKIELIQIRERNLSARQLAELTRKVLQFPNPGGTRILVNDRADIALACRAHGVHLRDNAVSPATFARPGFIVTVSCHSPVDAPSTAGADYVLLAPIFKPLSKEDDRPPLGIAAIEEFRRRSSTPVLALGGITGHNARACIDAGAAGIAGIKYFAL
jgi:thiamine-phosphate pyrophosphorylase